MDPIIEFETAIENEIGVKIFEKFDSLFSRIPPDRRDGVALNTIQNLNGNYSYRGFLYDNCNRLELCKVFYVNDVKRGIITGFVTSIMENFLTDVRKFNTNYFMSRYARHSQLENFADSDVWPEDISAFPFGEHGWPTYSEFYDDLMASETWSRDTWSALNRFCDRYGIEHPNQLEVNTW